MQTERAIKRNFYAVPHQIWVETAPGVVEITKNELLAIIANPVGRGKYMPEVEVSSNNKKLLVTNLDFRFMLELCRRLKTARQVYWLLKRGKATGQAQFTKRLAAARLQAILVVASPINIKVRSFNSRLYHEKMLQEMAYQYWQEQGFSPSTDEGSQKILCELKDNRLDIYLALGGGALYKRGYRQSFKTPAPMREDLAHALIRASLQPLSGIEPADAPVDQVFVPFCGSGTMAFETLHHLLDVPAFLWQRKYAFENWAILPEVSDSNFKKQTLTKYQKSPAMALPEVVLMDRNALALKESQANFLGFTAPLTKEHQEKLLTQTTILQGDFFSHPCSFLKPAGNLFIPLNPPYGQRLSLGERSSAKFFAAISQRLSAIASDHRGQLSGFCLIPDEVSWSEFLRCLSLTHSTTKHISLGGADMRIVFFQHLIRQV